MSFSPLLIAAASNLVDGVNFTRDDLHAWLALVYMPMAVTNGRLVDGAPEPVLARVLVQFCAETALSLVSVFN